MQVRIEGVLAAAAVLPGIAQVAEQRALRYRPDIPLHATAQVPIQRVQVELRMIDDDQPAVPTSVSRVAHLAIGRGVYGRPGRATEVSAAW